MIFKVITYLLLFCFIFTFIRTIFFFRSSY